MAQFFLFTALLCGLLSIATPLRCYNCDPKIAGKCEALETNNVPMEACPEDNENHHYFCISSLMSFKDNSSSNGIYRGCRKFNATENANNICEAFKQQTNSQNILIENCESCKTDNCNVNSFIAPKAAGETSLLRCYDCDPDNQPEKCDKPGDKGAPVTACKANTATSTSVCLSTWMTIKDPANGQTNTALYRGCNTIDPVNVDKFCEEYTEQHNNDTITIQECSACTTDNCNTKALGNGSQVLPHNMPFAILVLVIGFIFNKNF